MRSFYPGMGQAVAERTILRKIEGEWETWDDVSKRVALGNSLLCPTKEEQNNEYNNLYKHLSNASLLMSGRHLQHGDETQPTRNMEVMSNCATACTSFTLFYLLMNGSGVGRSYDDDLMLVNWENSPMVRCVLEENHPDFDYSAHESVKDAKHKYGKDVIWFDIEDTREGWASALEFWENLTFEKIHKDKLLVLNFSKIRCKGSPIKGMQGRPASGPVPLMNAFNKSATIKSSGLPPWKQSIYIDHYFADCVLVGGARRSARMSTKYWKDKTIFDFITVKRPIEYIGLNTEEIVNLKSKSVAKPQGFLWSSNNSITVDKEFWNLISVKKGDFGYKNELAKHARAVFKLATSSAYGDGTGEPGFINVDKLNSNSTGLDSIEKDYVSTGKYQIHEDTQFYLNRLLRVAKKKKYSMIVNPCSEIPLAVWGGFCVIADVVPYHSNTLEEAEEAFRAAVRALMRVNLMPSIYQKEVQRTNRIGVSITGIHEFAWKFFKFGFRDLIDENISQPFWDAISRFKRAVQDEAEKYAAFLGVNVPHTDTTIKPAGTTSKLFGLTEGWHLASMLWYLRWVQFSKDDPLIQVYKKAGYPTRELVKYQNVVIVGFPTQPVIATLNLGDKMVTAAEATPAEQYKWLMLGEKYWLRGVDCNREPLTNDTGSQISYTLKYNPKLVDYKVFKNTLKEFQSQVKCCAVMPQEEDSTYEYLPEQPISKAEYDIISKNIKKIKINEDIDLVHVDCSTGACPIDFRKSGD